MKKSNSFNWKPIFCSLTLLILLTGCWSANEINNLSIINVMAIDENESGEVEVTVVIAKPYTLFPNTAIAGEQQSKYVVETKTGDSIFEALGGLSSAVSERMYFGHMDVVIFGEQAARERMLSSLDFFKRQTDFRPNVHLLVTKGSARDLVKTLPQHNISLGLELKDLINTNRFAMTNMVRDISQFTEKLLSNTTDPYTGRIHSAAQNEIDIEGPKQTNSQSETQSKDKKEPDSTMNRNKQEIPQALSLRGTAVFKDGQLKGFLNERETQGLLALKGELRGEVMVLNCENKEGEASLKITGSEAKVSPSVSSKNPKVSIDLRVEADIGELTCPGLNVNSDQLEHFNQQLESVIRRDISIVLNKAKNQWQTDIFGFGQAFYRKHPKEWEQMAPQWRNGLLKETEVHLSVQANISRYGLFKDPIQANK